MMTAEKPVVRISSPCSCGRIRKISYAPVYFIFELNKQEIVDYNQREEYAKKFQKE